MHGFYGASVEHPFVRPVVATEDCIPMCWWLHIMPTVPTLCTSIPCVRVRVIVGKPQGRAPGIMCCPQGWTDAAALWTTPSAQPVTAILSLRLAERRLASVTCCVFITSLLA